MLSASLAFPSRDRTFLCLKSEISVNDHLCKLSFRHAIIVSYLFNSANLEFILNEVLHNEVLNF